MVRKTKKYYIEQLKSNPSDEIIEEVLKKYCRYNGVRLEHQELGEYKIKRIIYIPILGICLSLERLNDDNEIDLACLTFDTIRRANEENSSLFFKVNDDTYLQITPNVFTDIINELIDYLSPES